MFKYSIETQTRSFFSQFQKVCQLHLKVWSWITEKDQMLSMLWIMPISEFRREGAFTGSSDRPVVEKLPFCCPVLSW